MKLDKLLKHVQVDEIQPKGTNLSDINIHKVTADSRAVTSDSLFVAVKGLASDGHAFVPDAIKKGAAAILYDEDLPKQKSKSIVFIKVSNSRKALSFLACAMNDFPSRSVEMVGITGTNGKTTSTYILESIFKSVGQPGVIGTVNYRYGGKVFAASHTTPDALSYQLLLRKMVENGVTHVVSEVSSHGLSLFRTEGTDIDVALFTNLTQDHLDFHADFNDYFEAKKRLFTEILPKSQKKSKCAVINIDDPFGVKIVQASGGQKYITYSLSNTEANVYAESYQFGLSGLKATLVTPDGKMNIRSALLGYFNLLNIIGSVAVSMALNIPFNAIEAGIYDLKNVPGRLERVDKGQGFVVLVDYAHTDDALKNVGQALQKIKQQRIITIFGCGGDRDNKKRPLMAKAAASFSDIVIVTSDNPRTEDPEKIIDEAVVGLKELSVPIFTEKKDRGYMILIDRKEAIAKGIELAEENDIVLIAGKGHEDYQILGTKKIHFDDREVAAACLEKKIS